MIAAETVAVLRLDAGRHPDDPQLAALVGEFSLRSPEFPRWWADHSVSERTHGRKRYRHPFVGDLTIEYEALCSPDDPEQTLFIYSTEPGSPSADAIALLSSWIGGRGARAPGGRVRADVPDASDDAILRQPRANRSQQHHE
jgi:hypothetical protein